MYSMALQRWGSHSQQENQKGHLLVSGRCRVGLNLDPGSVSNSSIHLKSIDRAI